MANKGSLFDRLKNTLNHAHQRASRRDLGYFDAADAYDAGAEKRAATPYGDEWENLNSIVENMLYPRMSMFDKARDESDRQIRDLRRYLYDVRSGK